MGNKKFTITLITPEFFFFLRLDNPPPAPFSALRDYYLLSLNVHMSVAAPHTSHREKKKKIWIQHQTVPGWSPTPVLSRLNAA